MFRSLRTVTTTLPSRGAIQRTTFPSIATLQSRQVSRSSSEKDSSAKIPSKDDLNPQPKEYTKSGTHDEIAQDEDAAFNPDKTNPAEMKATAGEEEASPKSGAQNPLEYSPATPEVSHQVKDERAESGSKDRTGGSSGGSKAAH